MGILPRPMMRLSLALVCLLASCIVAPNHPAVAAPAPEPGVASRLLAAAALSNQGHAITARQDLIALLDIPVVRDDPLLRNATLQTILDVCLANESAACIQTYAGLFAESQLALPAANPLSKRQMARKALYYVGEAFLRNGAPEVLAKARDGQTWNHTDSADAPLYLRSQILCVGVAFQFDDYAGSSRCIDKALSLLAALKNPQDSRLFVAQALAKAIAGLVDIGETERAFGIHKATGDFVSGALWPLSYDMVLWRLAEAELLEETGDLRRSAASLDIAVDTLSRIELDDDTRVAALSRALTLKAVVCTADGRVDCARTALASHPLASRYAKTGPTPGSYGEVTYLAARAFVAAASHTDDPVARQALAKRGPDGQAADMQGVYRIAGAALALPPGAARQQGLLRAGQGLTRAVAARPAGAFGAWYRPGTVDQTLIALALSAADQGGPADDDAVFALFQLAGRKGPAFDADAFTALARAEDALQRRAVHQALRLRARRDRHEREQLQAMTLRAAERPAAAPLTHDFAARRVFAEFGARLDMASQELQARKVAVSGSEVVPLARFQAALAADEAALAVAPVDGGFAYLCIRNGSVTRKTAAADLQAIKLDIRIVQLALTASGPPSPVQDAQFPVEAAVRLYGALIRPFDSCLKANDRILWLASPALAPLPLGVLLPAAPAKLNSGWDLASADWLARRHALSYAGAAGVILAARSPGSGRSTDFDFLGVGDPVLTDGRAPSGSRLSDLAPLPETQAELERSAQGFRTSRLLTRNQATESGLRGQMVGAYRYLSFATHGLIRDDLQGLADPALVLTPVSDQDPANDGLLTASEIADLNLSAAFVALSACNTANYDLDRASSDLPALASAFAVAGTPATLATLWPVDSASSAQIVAATFAHLQKDPSAGPAQALAAAQRAFLAAPPGRAYLHPRFWAPFVLLGDGGRLPDPRPSEFELTAVEPLTRGGGEVLALRRIGERIVTRFMSEKDASGRYGSGMRATAADSRRWDRRVPGVGAMGVMAMAGQRLVAGGYEPADAGRTLPVLESFDPATGQVSATWRGEVSPGLSAFVMAGVQTGSDRAVFAVVDQDFKMTKSALGVRIMETSGAGAPRLLFEITQPAGASTDDVTLTVVGKHLLVTRTQRFPPRAPLALTVDDYDQPLCGSQPITWLELRDLDRGALVASRELKGLVVHAAIGQGGGALLAGSVKPGCAEARAAVIEIDAALQVRPRYVDDSMGSSEARAISTMADGQAFIAVQKEDIFDYRPDARRKTGEELPVKLGAMLLTLGTDASSPPTLLHSGGYLFASAADASVADDILVGGGLGDEAVIYHLKARR